MKIESLIYNDNGADLITFLFQCCCLFATMSPELVGEPMEAECMYDAVNVIMSLQSPNGGVSAWEPTGAPKWLEVNTKNLLLPSISMF